MQLPDLKGVRNASENLQGVSVLTPLVINERLSNELNCKIINCFTFNLIVFKVTIEFRDVIIF